jgi:hypothetical protein
MERPGASLIGSKTGWQGMVSISFQRKRLVLVSGLVSLALSSGLAVAQQTPVRVRGAVEAIDGSHLTIKSRDGADVRVHLADKVRITVLVKATLEDVKPDSYIGIVSVPESDGMQHTKSIHIFPEAMRGTGEGQRPWDTGPMSLMTNGSVRTKVSAKDGQLLTIKAKDEEKKIVVDEGTPIVAFTTGTMDDLKVGAQVIISNAVKSEDGTFEAPAINVGRNLTPAM